MMKHKFRQLSDRTSWLLRELSPQTNQEKTKSALEYMTAVLNEIKERGEIAAIPELFRKLFTVPEQNALAIAEAIEHLFRLVLPTELTWLDAYTRHSIYWGMKAIDLNWEGFGGLAAPVLGIGSFHRDGYVREAVIRKLRNIHTGAELPFLLIRLNDWVPVIRETAFSAVQERLSPGYAPHFVTYLAFMAQLKNQQRANHITLVRAVEKWLKQEENHQALFSGLDSDFLPTRRACFQVALTLPEMMLSKVFSKGLQDKDPMIRLWVSQKIRSLENDSLAEYLPQLQHDSFVPVRREALRLYTTRFPEQARAKLYEALLDGHASIRHEARILLFQNFSASDFDHFYRSLLVEGAGEKLDVAITGLGETGSAKDDQLILHYTSHERPKIRRTAIRAIARLNPAAHHPLFFQALQDPISKVSREAKEALLASRGYVAYPAMLWNHLMNATAWHVKMNALFLLAQLAKWESICYLLEAACLDDPLVVEQASSYIGRWLQIYNRSFILPKPPQLERMSLALTKTGSRLAAGKHRELEFIINGFQERMTKPPG